MKILQRSNYMIFLDDVRIDQYVVSWNVNNGLFANDATANITLFRSDAMDNWKSYLTQLKIFGENPFTKKFTLLFDGEIMNRSWNQNRSNMGKVTFQAKGYYHWLDIQVPMAIQATENIDPLLRFIYEAQNINIDEVRSLITTNGESLLKDKSIDAIIDQLFEKMTVGYYDVAEDDTAFGFAKIRERFKVMVDVLPEFRQSGFLDLFTFTKTSQIESFYVYLNEVLSQLMFEFYQDRDGSFRIKTPSWSEEVMKAHVIDSSIVNSISGLDDWENEPTRVLAIGAETQYMAAMRQQGTLTSEMAAHLTIPVGLYIGDPRDPDNEEYYSSSFERYLEEYGINPDTYGPGGAFASDEWFDNLTDSARVTSRHKSVNGDRPTHEGTDYGFPIGTPVYNVGTMGKVTHAGYHNSMGNYVTIEQNIGGQTYTFRYMHFNEPASVSPGQTVAPGQSIGKVGSTGHSTGPHLHLEVWVGKPNQGHTINLETFLKAQKAANASKPSGSSGSGSGSGAKQTSSKGTSAGGFEITAYTATCKGCSGITKEGWNVRNNSIDHRVIAVDPSVIPLGSIVEVGDWGLFNAVDIGGAIKGKKIDILVDNYSKAVNEIGRQHNIPVKIIRSGYGDGSRVPAVAIGQRPTWNGTSGSSGPRAGGGSLPFSRTYSSPYANVDGVSGFKRVDYSSGNKLKSKDRSYEEPKAVDYSKSAKATIPSYSKDLEGAINGNKAGVSPKLIGAVIEEASGWRENNSTSTHKGLMGIPNNYASEILGGHNLLEGSNSIQFGSDFLGNALERFNGKVSFALAAYHLGSLSEVEKIAKQSGGLDFSKVRGEFDADTLAFVDGVIDNYTGDSGNYIKGDPHKSFGKDLDTGGTTGEPALPNDPNLKDRAPAEDTGLPDFESTYRPRLSDEERKYKVNLKRVEQALIRADSPVVNNEGGLSADQLIYQFAKYNMQLHRARTHNVNISLATCLPFIRPGYNAWIEPTRTDVVCYITGVSHRGSFQDGCYTSLTGGFVRSPDNYRDIDTSIFIGETLSTSADFGDLVPDSEFQSIRNELNSMHGKDLVDEAQNFTVLNDLYSSMNGSNDYTTQWNKEYTQEEIMSLMGELFAGAPPVVQERRNETKEAIAASEEIFLEKLLYTKH